MKHFQNLDDIDLTLPLGGNEGIDKNYASRVRAQFLFSQHQTLITQMQFADAKAAVLMTLMGFIAVRGPIELSSEVIFEPGSLICLSVILASILTAMLSIFPRYPNRETRDAMGAIDRWSWPSLAGSKLSAEDFARFMQTCEVSQMVVSVALSNASISRILLSKYRMMRIAFTLAFIALIMVAGVYLEII